MPNIPTLYGVNDRDLTTFYRLCEENNLKVEHRGGTTGRKFVVTNSPGLSQEEIKNRVFQKKNYEINFPHRHM